MFSNSLFRFPFQFLRSFLCFSHFLLFVSFFFTCRLSFITQLWLLQYPQNGWVKFSSRCDQKKKLKRLLFASLSWGFFDRVKSTRTFTHLHTASFVAGDMKYNHFHGLFNEVNRFLAFISRCFRFSMFSFPRLSKSFFFFTEFIALFSFFNYFGSLNGLLCYDFQFNLRLGRFMKRFPSNAVWIHPCWAWSGHFDVIFSKYYNFGCVDSYSFISCFFINFSNWRLVNQLRRFQLQTPYNWKMLFLLHWIQ